MISMMYEIALNRIILIPSDKDDFDFLEKNLAEITSYDKTLKVFYVEPDNTEKLRYLLVPKKRKLSIDPSFRDFLVKHDSKGKKLVIISDVIISKFEGSLDKIPVNAIDKVTSFFLKSATNTKEFKAKKWDGMVHLYDKMSKTFPSGLLFLVEAELKKANVSYDIIYKYDRSPPKQFNWLIDDGKTPDIDQLEAVRETVRFGRCVVKAPTGFGKTALLAKRLAAEYGVPTLFVANKKSLLDDAKAEFMDGVYGLDAVGQIMDGIFDQTKLKKDERAPDIKSPIIVATIQSLDAKLRDPRTSEQLKYWLRTICKLIIIDETQAVGTATWDNVLNICMAPYRVCLSATPRRTDGATLRINATSGDCAFYTTAAEQIVKGRLSEVEVIYHVFDHKLYNQDDDQLEYAECYTEFVAINEKRNLVVIEKALDMVAEGRHVLILISRIEHGELVRNLLIENGLTEEEVLFICGSTKDEARRNAITEFRKGSFKVLVGSTIFDAGVNIPIISGIVLAGAGNSEITQIQRIGRGVRNADYESILGYLPEFMQETDGKVCKVIDFLDTNVKFFERQSWNRYNTTKEEFGASRVRISGKIEKQAKPTKVKSTLDDKTLEDRMSQLSSIFSDNVDNSKKEDVISAAISSFANFFK